jgi:hypothetical protein
MPKPRGRSRRTAQTSIYETTREDPELEAALRSRESMKSALGTAKQNFETADTKAQSLIAKLELGDDAAVRVGDFVITAKRTKGHTVQSFDVESTQRIRIKPIEPEPAE